MAIQDGEGDVGINIPLEPICTVCAAVAAVANVWIAITNRQLRERQIKRDIIRKFLGVDRQYPRDLPILMEIGVVFNNVPAVMAILVRLYKAWSTESVSEFQEVSNELTTAMYKAADLKVIPKAWAFREI